MNSINLNELNIDNMGQWPMPVKLGIIFSSIVLILGLSYWVFIQPNFDKLASLAIEEKSLRSDFEQKQAQAANIAGYRAQLQEMQLRFGDVLKQLPAENEMPGLLEDISKTGTASGLKFELFAPQADIIHDFYVEVPIKIKVVGNYEQLATFLSRIAEMHRIVTLHDFSILGASVDKPLGSSGEGLVMEITAKIYRYRSQ
jgi:type IV pilus assembly protein PilO